MTEYTIWCCNPVGKWNVWKIFLGKIQLFHEILKKNQWKNKYIFFFFQTFQTCTKFCSRSFGDNNIFFFDREAMFWNNHLWKKNNMVYANQSRVIFCALRFHDFFPKRGGRGFLKKNQWKNKYIFFFFLCLKLHSWCMIWVV